MTRLALAKTLVQGTMTLQGNTYIFTGSGSGTATADRVPEAKKLAVAASNTAASAAARASIDKILTDNSAILSDLEITSLISNNFTTTVRVFKPIALASIATTTDGIKYYLNKATTIESDQWLTVPDGKTLSNSVDTPFTNYGFVQFGDSPQTSSASAKLKDSGCSSLYFNTLVDGCSSDDICNFVINSGCITIQGTNYGNIYNYASVTVSTGKTLYNECNGSGFTNYCGATFQLDGAIINVGENSFSSVNTAGNGTCKATGTGSTCNMPCTPRS